MRAADSLQGLLRRARLRRAGRGIDDLLERLRRAVEILFAESADDADIEKRF